MIAISVVIATYNSGKTLSLVLESIRNQTVLRSDIEILIVDGGSTDKTRSIAKKYGCRIIDNPNIEPLYAKYLGYIHAKGRYIEYVDHDEVLMNAKSLQTRVDIFKNNPTVKAVTGCGYYSPSGYQVINSYINEFGDPFSFFIYSLSKHADFFIPSMKSRYKIVKDSEKYTLFDISNTPEIPLIELVAGGGMFDRIYMVKNFPELTSQQYLLPHLLHVLRKKSPYIAVVKNDPILHYSSDTVSSYIQKLIWRIKNNIFFSQTTGSSGFSGRGEFSAGYTSFRKILFIPYAFSIVLPLIDAIKLISTRKNYSYGIHVPLTLITATLIVYYYVIKIVGFRPVLRNYDGSVNAYERS